MITIVAGIPRSGTSLTMRMLDAAGVEPFCDPDSYNIGYEAAITRLLPERHEWLGECEGKAVKLMNPHKQPPPRRGYDYRIIWLERDPHQQAKNHLKILKLLGIPKRERSPFKRLARSIERDTRKCRRLLREYRQSLLVVRFERKRSFCDVLPPRS